MLLVFGKDKVNVAMVRLPPPITLSYGLPSSTRHVDLSSNTPDTAVEEALAIWSECEETALHFSSPSLMEVGRSFLRLDEPSARGGMRLFLFSLPIDELISLSRGSAATAIRALAAALVRGEGDM